MFICPVQRMRHRKAVALALYSIRSHVELTVWYSGENVFAVSPACSGDRQRDLLCGAIVRLPFMTIVSVSFHSPGVMPSAAARRGIVRQEKAASETAARAAAQVRREAGRLQDHLRDRIGMTTVL
jgi:hypothetical protein